MVDIIRAASRASHRPASRPRTTNPMTTRKYRTTAAAAVPSTIRTPLPTYRAIVRPRVGSGSGSIGGLLGQDLVDGGQVSVDVPVGVRGMVDGDLPGGDPAAGAADLPPHLAARLDPFVQAGAQRVDGGFDVVV